MKVKNSTSVTVQVTTNDGKKNKSSRIWYCSEALPYVTQCSSRHFWKTLLRIILVCVLQYVIDTLVFRTRDSLVFNMIIAVMKN